MKPWKYLILFLLPLLVVTGFLLEGWWNFLLPACCFLVYPAVNIYFSPHNETDAHTHDENDSANYSRVALIFVPALIVLTAWCVYKVSKTNLDSISYSGFFLSLGIVTGILGFTLAHEFIHRFTKRF